MARPKKFPHTITNRYGKVTVYRTSNGTYTSYKIVWSEGRVAKRESRADEDTALDRAQEILGDITAGAASRPDATAQQWSYFQRCESLLKGVPLITAVEYFMAHGLKVDPVTEMTVVDVVSRFIESRKSSGRCERYLRTLKYDLDPVAAAMRKPFSRVNVADLDAYLATIGNTRTRHNKRGSITSCWRWARSKGWLPRDKATAADLTDTPEVSAKDPGILSADDLKTALYKAEQDDTVRQIIPYLVIAAFAGVRSAEICRLTWEDHIKLDQGVIILGSDITKTKRRRVIQMEPTLIEWLSVHQSTGKVVAVSRPHRLIATLHSEAPWPHNALRHSAVSYLMALHRNAAMVAEQCGHTEAQLQSQYKAAVTTEQALQWFNIPPKWQAIQTQQKVVCV
jgi:integrase